MLHLYKDIRIFAVDTYQKKNNDKTIQPIPDYKKRNINTILRKIEIHIDQFNEQIEQYKFIVLTLDKLIYLNKYITETIENLDILKKYFTLDNYITQIQELIESMKTCTIEQILLKNKEIIKETNTQNINDIISELNEYEKEAILFFLHTNEEYD